MSEILLEAAATVGFILLGYKIFLMIVGFVEKDGSGKT